MQNGNNNLLKRATGLLVLEVVNSNPNGDPDNESDPRTRVGNYGEISPVSFKRKVRDLVEQKDGPVWQAMADAFEPSLQQEEFDMVVLSVGLEPHSDSDKIRRLLPGAEGHP